MKIENKMAAVYGIVIALLVFWMSDDVCADCLNNYDARHVSSWFDGTLYKTNGHITPTFKGILLDWQLQIEFTAPLAEDLKVWIAKGSEGSEGKTTVVLTPKPWNKWRTRIRGVDKKGTFDLSYIASFSTKQAGSHLKCVQFCGTLKSGEKLCSLVTPQPPVTGSIEIPKKCGRKIVKVQGRWKTGFNGYFSIKVPESIEGWKIRFRVDKPYDHMRPHVANYDNTNNVYQFWNRDHNGRVEAGGILDVPFTARYYGRRRPPMILSVYLEYHGVGSSESKLRHICGDIEVPVTGSPLLPTTPQSPTTMTLSMCRSVLKEENVWQEGEKFKFNAIFSVYVPVTIKSWKLTFAVDKPFDDIRPYDAVAESESDGSYQFTNRAHGGNFIVHAGRTLRIGFEGSYYAGQKPKILTAAFEVVDHSSSEITVLDLCKPAPTTTQQPTTTKIPPTTTKLPPKTTKIPPKTSKIPPKTTKNPPKTTKILPKTTKIPPKTTKIPPKTTKMPPKTTKIPPKTTKIPPKTTKMPQKTTKIPPKTTKFPPKTTKIPPKTTKLPPKTTKMPQKTTKIPPKTTKVPPKTTKIPPKTTKRPPKTTESPQTTTNGATTVIPPICTPKYNYSEVLEKSLLFYEAQRSGRLPENNRIKWRNDSALDDGSDVSIDLSGGYYDAGDYVKFGFPMASSITNLAWGMIEFTQGYKLSNQYEYGLDALKWGTDYFIKCHTEKLDFYGQVGDGDEDHKVWGRPEDMVMQRPSSDITASKPGSDLAGETAAALAATSIVFRESGNVSYADSLLQHAEDLYHFADTHHGRYDQSITKAAKFYKSYSGYEDELAWACLWLFMATEKQTYKQRFVDAYKDKVLNQGISEFSWDNKWAGVGVLAARLQLTPDDYLSQLYTRLETGRRTPKGLFWVQQWGPNRHAANLAFLSLVASKVKDKGFYEKFTRQQIHYMLGDAGRSFVVGFGKYPPQRPHHRSSSCPSDGPCDWNNYNSPDPNPHILYGALVGGPGENDDYVDDRKDFIKNEVAMDYNAGFQSAVAGLAELAGDGKCGQTEEEEVSDQVKNIYEVLKDIADIFRDLA